MLAVSKRNIVVPGPDGERLRLEQEVMTSVPAWAEKSSYFQALVKDGKITLSVPAAEGGKPRKQKEPGKKERFHEALDHAVSG